MVDSTASQSRASNEPSLLTEMFQRPGPVDLEWNLLKMDAIGLILQTVGKCTKRHEWWYAFMTHHGQHYSVQTLPMTVLSQRKSLAE